MLPATVTDPVLLPKQRTLVCDEIDPDRAAAGWVMVTGTLNVQLFASFTVTEYEPAVRELKVPEAWKFTPSMLYW